MVVSDAVDDDSDDESASESIAPSHQEGDVHPSGGDLSVVEEHVDFEPQQDEVESPSPRYPKRNRRKKDPLAIDFKNKRYNVFVCSKNQDVPVRA